MVSTPPIPNELVTDILYQLWTTSGPMTTTERTHLLTTIPLVSRLFRRIFRAISYRDVYIPTEAFASDYLDMLRHSNILIQNNRGDLVPLRTLCRSITFELVNETIYAPLPDSLPTPEEIDWSKFDLEQPRKKSMLDVMTETLYSIDHYSASALPNLRRLIVRNVNKPFEELFSNFVFAYVPEQVTTLELSYEFDKSMPSFLLDALRDDGNELQMKGVSFRHIRRLVVTGAGSWFVRDLERACNSVDEIITDVDMKRRSPQLLSQSLCDLPVGFATY